MSLIFMRNFARWPAMFVNIRAVDGLRVQSWRNTVPGRLVRSAQANRIDADGVVCAPAHPHTSVTAPIAEQKLTEAALAHWGFCAFRAREHQRLHKAAPPNTPLTLTRSRWEEQ